MFGIVGSLDRVDKWKYVDAGLCNEMNEINSKCVLVGINRNSSITIVHIDCIQLL